MVKCTQHYRENFTVKGVQAKLESILTILEDVELYVNALRKGVKMQKVHRETILKRLTHFLVVCALFTKVQRDSRTVVGVLKNIVKTIARDDDGITSELKTIHDLNEKEKGTLMIDDWSTNQLVFNYIKQHDREVMTSQKLQSVKDALGLSEKGNDWAPWKQIHSSLNNSDSMKAHPWILDNEKFKEWASPEKDPQKPVLILEAPKGSGSTHLCYSVIEKLRSSQGQEEDTSHGKHRTQTAYFYFEDLGKGDSSKTRGVTKTPIRDALAALLWQLTKQDQAFQTFVSRPHSKLGTTTELWETLVTRFPRGQNSKHKLVFFLILDEINLAAPGTGEDITTILNRLIKGAAELQGKQYQVRILFTGRPETFGGLSQDTSRAAEKIQVERENRKDIETFIQDGISKIKQSWGSGDAEQNNLIDSIEAQLLKRPPGNFEDAILALDEIQRTKGNEELREILNHGPGDRSRLLSLHLEKLSEKLKPDGIEELNDLLICLVLFNIWPNMDQLAKFLRLGKDTRPKGLDDRIRDDYYQLIAIENNSTCTRRSFDTCAYFTRLQDTEQPNRSRNQVNQGPQNAGEKIELIELEAMERLISSLYGTKAFDRFQFKDHFRRLREQQNSPRPVIHVDFTIGHLEIISRLLKAVCAKDQGDFKCLHAYAGLHLPFHLGQIKLDEVEWEEMDPRKELHDHLHMFFTDEDCVSRWFNDESERTILDRWREWYESIGKVKHWFEKIKYDRSVERSGAQNLAQSGGDSSGLESVNSGTEFVGNQRTEAADETVERASVETLPNGPATGTDDNSSGEGKKGERAKSGYGDPRSSLLLERESIFRALIKVLAKRWLRDYNWDSSRAFNSFLDFAAKVCCEYFHLSYIVLIPAFFQDPQSIIQSSADFDSDGKHSVQKIADAEKAASALCSDREDENSQVQNVRVAEILLNNGHYENAIARCEKYHTDWRANWCVAQSYRDWNRREQALEAIERNFGKLLDKEFRKEYRNKWEMMVKALWRLYSGSTKARNTTTIFRKLHEKFSDDQSTNEIILECVYGDDDYKALRYFLSSEYASPVTLFIQYAINPGFHDNVCAALENDLGGIIKAYLDAITATKSDLYKRAHLRFYYGKAMFRNGKVQEAMIIWEENMNEMYGSIKQDDARNDDLFEIRNKCAINFAWGSIWLIRKPNHSKLLVAEFTRKVELLKSRCDFALENDPVHHLTLLLGRHYALDGQSYRTRRCIRSHVERAMELLADDIDSNDWEGYWKLCQALIPVEDDDNVKAAWSLIEDEHLFSLMHCDGGCGCKGGEWAKEDIYICRECEDVQLNEKCLKRLRQGELRVCGKDHDHIQLPKWDADASKARHKEGKVEVGSKKLEIDEWLKKIKRDYGIQTESGSEVTEQHNQRFRKAVQNFRIKFRTAAKTRPSKTMSKSSESRKSDRKSP